MNKQSLDTDPRWTDSILVKLAAVFLLIGAVDIVYFSTLRFSGLMMRSVFEDRVRFVLFLNFVYFGMCFCILQYRVCVVLKEKVASDQWIMKSIKKEESFFRSLSIIFFIILITTDSLAFANKTRTHFHFYRIMKA